MNQLEIGDLEDNEVKLYVEEIKQIIENYRQENAETMKTILQAHDYRIDGNVIGGLKKHILKSYLPFGGCVRWVCKKHAKEFDECFD